MFSAPDTEELLEVNLQEIIEGDSKMLIGNEIPEEIALLSLRNTVLFPGVVIPVTVARDKSIELVKDAQNNKQKIIGVLAQRNSSTEDPSMRDLYQIGTLAVILRKIKMPDGSITIVIQGKNRFKVEEVTQEVPFYKATIKHLAEIEPNADETQAMTLSLKQEATKIIELSPNIPTEANITLSNISNLDFLVHFIASNLNLDVKEKQAILETKKLMRKAEIVLEFLSKELQVLELSEEIQSKVRTDLDKQQRDFLLRQQIRAIHDELGDESYENDIEEMKAKGVQQKWPEVAQAAFDKELYKLSRSNPSSPEYSVSLNYLDWMLELPWGKYSTDSYDLKKARQILDNDHYGLEKVKERIIEYLAVLQLKADKKAPILCFFGPPGVGKTSLGKSIAKALDRSFIRMSLGGVRDEAEIRGHRKTYIGAMPGRILQGLKKAKTGNPVFMLDEIDKVGNDFRGDPSSALLEVLDPEQNSSFNDHYIELDYDLSTIMFITTANNLATIHPALRDRMEVIEINGYTIQEKKEIAKKHLLPRIRSEHGIKAKQLKLSAKILDKIIAGYTRESGVRMLSQKLAGICRGVAKEIVEGEMNEVSVTKEGLIRYLGYPTFQPDDDGKPSLPGVAMGLAWTAAGGEMLHIETVLMQGTGKLTLTGQLGEVMKESARLAHIYLKANAEKYNIPIDAFRKWDVHMHIPAGAIPKDGPSAGITIVSAMASVFTQRLIKKNLAMTGEITLRGRVLPVGGIKEKILAAARAGYTSIILCDKNKKDIEEIDKVHLGKMKFHYVSDMDEVLGLALDPQTIPNPLNLDISTPVGSHQPLSDISI